MIAFINISYYDYYYQIIMHIRINEIYLIIFQGRMDIMAKRREDIKELLKLAGKLPEKEQLELISKISYRLSSKRVVKSKPKTWMKMAGLGKEIWKDIDAKEYVRQERGSWGK
jgi:hypothetical protein